VRRCGVSIVYLAIGLTVFIGFCSFAVDLGRVELAKTQLQAAADASARAAASAIGDATKVQTRAVQFAAANKCDGLAVAVDGNQDVDFGTWDGSSKTFTVVTGSQRISANAIRVTCRRTTNRQNAIPLMFMVAAGKGTCDVTASAIAAVEPSGYGMVGLNYIKLSGNSTASYFSATATVGGGVGHIASNGNITSSGTSSISGNVYVLPGKTVSGVTAKAIKNLTSSLTYSTYDPYPYSKTYNDDAQIPVGFVNSTPDFNAASGTTVSIPGGNYVFNNFSVAGTAVVTFTGSTTIYYYGNFSMTGKTVTASSIPNNLKIIGINKPDGKPPGSLTIGGSASLYGSIYSPGSDITLSGTGNIYGSVLGKSITMSGSADLYYDLSLPGAGAIHLVK
jgi:hypothetical protein